LLSGLLLGGKRLRHLLDTSVQRVHVLLNDGHVLGEPVLHLAKKEMMSARVGKKGTRKGGLNLDEVRVVRGEHLNDLGLLVVEMAQGLREGEALLVQRAQRLQAGDDRWHLLDGDVCSRHDLIHLVHLVM
jgi:hypothetical protein